MESQQPKRAFNFSAGPCILPVEVLEKAKEEAVSWGQCGISPMELSHRGSEFTTIAQQAEKDFREFMNVPDNYEVFFFQGGASLQFTAVPLNLLRDKTKANYLVTGSWSSDAAGEAKKFCQVNDVWDAGKKFTTVGDPSTWKIDPEGAFFHFCDNETVHGVEFPEFPFEKVPAGMEVVADMSSNICSRPVAWEKYGVVYAGAQKNLGLAGVCLVVVRKDLIGHHLPTTPLMCDWALFNKAPCKFHNTPATWPIYVTGLNIAHMKKNGIQYYAEFAQKKSALLYDFIDNSNGYYSNPVEKKYRSRMNVPFRVKCDDALENKFLKEAEALGLVQLKGHRNVGGCRASIYNGMPMEGVETLVNFMKKFQQENP